MRYVSVFLLFFILLSCKKEETVNNEPPPVADSSLHYLALGDSYTVGTAIGRSNSFSSQLAARLEGEAEIDMVELDIIAQGGWTTSDLLAALNSNPPQDTFDLVSLLIGVNNEFQQLGLKEYRQEFGILLQKAIEYAGGDSTAVIVLSIPDYGVTPVGSSMSDSISVRIDRFNAIKAAVAEENQVSYFDITGLSRSNSALVAADSLHFSTAMHSLWVDAIYPDVIQILSPSP